jgi:hypothetical protein
MIVVKYAATIGKCTLDMEVLSREEVYKHSWLGADGEWMLRKCSSLRVNTIMFPSFKVIYKVKIGVPNSIGCAIPLALLNDGLINFFQLLASRSDV